MKIDINTTHYEQQHGKAPHHNQKGRYTFMTPHRRRWQFADVAYNRAVAELTDRAKINEGAGEYILLP